MNPQHAAILLFGILVLTTANASAEILNGDFETGDFTAWTASAIDDFGDPLVADDFIRVVNDSGNHFVAFRTGAYSEGLFLSTLEQTFDIAAEMPVLRFDFSLPYVAPDPSGTGASPFLDAFFVSVDNGVESFDLILLDEIGALPDPFGTAPGDVRLNDPSDPFFEFEMRADLSALVGQTVTLYLDVISEDDGAQFVLDPDNFRMTVPEPVGFAWIGFAGFLLLRSSRNRSS